VSDPNQRFFSPTLVRFTPTTKPSLAQVHLLLDSGTSAELSEAGDEDAPTCGLVRRPAGETLVVRGTP
jgi:hypothetical protein